MKAALQRRQGNREPAMLTAALLTVWVLLSAGLVLTAVYTMTAEDF
jgi:hypothetical protein